jgi:hypothetical protein
MRGLSVSNQFVEREKNCKVKIFKPKSNGIRMKMQINYLNARFNMTSAYFKLFHTVAFPQETQRAWCKAMAIPL